MARRTSPLGRHGGLRGRAIADMHLPVDPSSVERARAFVVDTLSGWKADRHLEVATLLTSELVTNVVLHAGCDEMSLRVRLDDARLRVEVLDESPQLPTRTGTGNVMARGRGLTLVDALSTRWGADHVSNGKCVWFEVGQ